MLIQESLSALLSIPYRKLGKPARFRNMHAHRKAKAKAAEPED